MMKTFKEYVTKMIDVPDDIVKQWGDVVPTNPRQQAFDILVGVLEDLQKGEYISVNQLDIAKAFIMSSQKQGGEA